MDKLRALRTLGLSDKESKIYLALLELGRASAYTIATKAGIKKPTTYVLLEELIEKNFVLRVPKSKKQLFVARQPRELFERTRAELSDAESLIPELMSLMRQSDSEVKTLFFEGESGIRDAWWYKLDEFKDTEMKAFYASTVDFPSNVAKAAHDWNKELVRLGVKTRAIVPEHPSLAEWRRLDSSHSRKVRVVPHSQYSSRIAIEINDRLVRILMFKDLQAIVIDNPQVAETMSEIFEMAWNAKS